MESLLEKLPSINILQIITEIRNVIDLMNFDKTYPKFEKLTLSIVTYLYSDKMLTVYIEDIFKFKYVIMSSYNILVIIKTPLDFLLFNNFQNIKQMNFDIGDFKNIKDTLKYIDVFLRNLNGKSLYNKTFRLLFTINTSENILNKAPCSNYAYIFDRGYFTFANSNQIRNITDKTYYTVSNEIIYEIEELIHNYLEEIPGKTKSIDKMIYTCVYTDKGYKSYKSNDNTHLNLFDVRVTNSLIKNSIIVLIKGESPDEIYYPSEILKEWNNINNTNNKIKYISQDIINLIINLYFEKNNLIITKKKKLYLRVWNDPIFCKYFNKSFFVRLLANETDPHNKSIVSQFIKNKVYINELSNFILNHSYPIDYIPKNNLYNLKLPCKKSYLE